MRIVGRLKRKRVECSFFRVVDAPVAEATVGSRESPRVVPHSFGYGGVYRPLRRCFSRAHLLDSFAGGLASLGAFAGGVATEAD